MYPSSIANIELKSAKSKSVHGFRRYALYSNHVYGLLVGDFDSRIKFGFVMYKPGPGNPEPIRVEIKRAVCCDGNGFPHGLEAIDPKFAKKFVDSLGQDRLELKQSLVVDDHTWYFKGYSIKNHGCTLPYILKCTMAAHFLDLYGDAFATMLLDNPKINTSEDANEVNDLLISVNAFANEMQSTPIWGTNVYEREQALKDCNEIKEAMMQAEQEMNHVYGRVQGYIEVLSNYGIDEKDIEFS